MRINLKKYDYVILTISIVLSAFVACKKKTTTTPPPYPIPYAPVYVTIYPNNPTNFKIQAIGGWIYYPGVGINGLIIYRKTQDEFVAIERTSPENPNVPASAVKVQSDNITLKDTIKNAKWIIIDGTAINGSSPWSLRLYATTYDGNALVIKN